MKKDLAEIQQSLGYHFEDIGLLREALTHSSYSNELKKAQRKNNERLEFLGDSILSLIISQHLFHKKKNLPEGILTKTRAALVCEGTLKDIAQDIGLGQHMILGKGEIATGGRNRASILADAMEAIIAAIYLDGGMQAASSFVLGRMEKKIEDSLKGKIMRDYKTQLQEIIQRNDKTPITYVKEEESGPDHDKTFTMTVRLGKRVIGRGTGKSKKEAEQQAAQNAMEKIKDE